MRATQHDLVIFMQNFIPTVLSMTDPTHTLKWNAGLQVSCFQGIDHFNFFEEILST